MNARLLIQYGLIAVGVFFAYKLLTKVKEKADEIIQGAGEAVNDYFLGGEAFAYCKKNFGQTKGDCGTIEYTWNKPETYYGVEYKYLDDNGNLISSKHELIDMRFAVFLSVLTKRVLDEASGKVIDVIGHIGIYNDRKTASGGHSRHADGMAIDIHGFSVNGVYHKLKSGNKMTAQGAWFKQRVEECGGQVSHESDSENHLHVSIWDSLGDKYIAKGFYPAPDDYLQDYPPISRRPKGWDKYKETGGSGLPDPAVSGWLDHAFDEYLNSEKSLDDVERETAVVPSIPRYYPLADVEVIDSNATSRFKQVKPITTIYENADNMTFNRGKFKKAGSKLK